MRWQDVSKIEVGDLLIYTPNGTRVPILGFTENKEKLKTIYNGREVTRAIGQLLKVCSKYNLIKKGEELKKSTVFYDPIKNKVIELSPGTIYLDEIE